MKKITDIFIWTGAFAVLFGLLSFANVMHDKQTCQEVVINVDQSLENHFVNNEDIRVLVHNRNGAIKGRELNDVDTQSIEAQVQNNPYVKNTEVYKTVNGKVRIHVNQRKPIVRVLTTENTSFYIDEDKRVMPLSNNFTARILFINGNISSNEINRAVGKNNSIIAGSKLEEIYELANYIHNSKLFKAQIEQVFVNELNEFELVPKVGRHTVLFGGIYDLKSKFNKLELFYKQGLKQVGWDKYNLVNLKYENQIVCTKK